MRLVQENDRCGHKRLQGALMISGLPEHGSRPGISRSMHSVLIERTNRSATALHCGTRGGHSTIWMPTDSIRLDSAGLFEASLKACESKKQSMRMELNDLELRGRWESLAEPAYEINDEVLQEFLQCHAPNRELLNCAVPATRARNLTDFQYPRDWNLDKCLISSVGRGKPSALSTFLPSAHSRYLTLRGFARVVGRK